MTKSSNEQILGLTQLFGTPKYVSLENVEGEIMLSGLVNLMYLGTKVYKIVTR